ncbi:MAG TPA: DMT family transporter [Candidatus Atribacteria bacterium]|nr:DMT family transporter [Candidatus Atribacteria bacterium]
MSKFLPEIAIIFGTMIWGATFMWVKEGISYLDPIYFIGLRFLLAFIFLLIIFPTKRNLSKNEIKIGVLIGITLLFAYITQTIGLKYTTISNNAFITGLFVIFVPFVSFLFKEENISLITILGTLMAAMGLYLLSFSGSGIGSINIGDLLTLLCAVLFAVQIVLVGRYTKKYDPVKLLIVQIFTVSILALFISFIMGTYTFSLKYGAIKSITLNAILGTAVAYYIQNKFQHKMPNTKAGLIFSLEPVFAGIFAYIFKGEVLSFTQIIGAALIFLAIVIIQVKGIKQNIESAREVI